MRVDNNEAMSGCLRTSIHHISKKDFCLFRPMDVQGHAELMKPRRNAAADLLQVKSQSVTNARAGGGKPPHFNSPNRSQTTDLRRPL